MPETTSLLSQINSAPTAAERGVKKARGAESRSPGSDAASFSKSLQNAEQSRAPKAKPTDPHAERNRLRDSAPVEQKMKASVSDSPVVARKAASTREQSVQPEAVDTASAIAAEPTFALEKLSETGLDWTLAVHAEPLNAAVVEPETDLDEDVLAAAALDVVSPWVAPAAVIPAVASALSGTVSDAPQEIPANAHSGLSALPADDLILSASGQPNKTADTSASGELLAWRSQYIDAAQASSLTNKSSNLEAPPESLLEAEAEVLALQPGAELANARLPGGSLHLGALSGKINVAVNAPFGTDQWQQAVGERAVLMVRQNIQSAELQLDPPELGPLQVRIQITHDHAVVNFSSANAQVRDALDQTMARLKEMLQEQGFSQVDTGVSDQSQRQFRQQSAPDRAGVDSGQESMPEQTLQVGVSSGIDYFA